MFKFLRRGQPDRQGRSEPRVTDNTFLLWEPCSRSHAEVVPGFTKYLLELGYSVSVLMTPERIDEGVFSRFSPEELARVYLNRMSQAEIRKSLRRRGPGAAKGILISTITDKIAIKDIPLVPGQKILMVSHDVRDDAAVLDERTITLRRVDYPGVRTVVVNPHYFGPGYFGDDASAVASKNTIVNFITVGALRDKRRNAVLLIEAVRTLHRAGTRNFTITVIGKGRLPRLERELRDYFRVPGRVDFRQMYEDIQKADFFLPLLDPENPAHERYITTGTSGSFQLIYGFAKPPLIARRFAPINGFNERNSVIYENNPDLGIAMERAIHMPAEAYAAKQKELADYARNLYRESLENLRCLLGSGV